MHPATTAQPDLRGKDAVIDWTGELLDQLDGHWTHQLRPRLDGLTDQEYLWEPVPGCWNIRARGAHDSPAAIGSGPFTFDLLRPPPSPAPVTTIAWRMAHLIVSVLGTRVAAQFGGPTVSNENFHYAGTAAEALAQLDGVYAAVDRRRPRSRHGRTQSTLWAQRGPVREPRRPAAGLPRPAHQPRSHPSRRGDRPSA